MNRKKLASELFTIVFLVGFVFYGLRNRDIFEGLRSVSVYSLLLVALGRMLVFVSNGLFTKWTAEAFTRKLSTGEGIYVGILSAIGNFFGPLLGGASIRAIYLKKVHNLSYSYFTSTLMGYYLILFIMNCVAAIISLMWLPDTKQTASLLLLFTVWLITLLALMVIKLPSKERFRKYETNKVLSKILKIIFDIEYGWQTLIRNKKLLLRLFFLAILSYGASFFISFIEFKAIGVPIGIAVLGLYTAIVAISLLVSLTPGSIGIREGLLILVSVTLGVSNDQILQVAVIDRGVMFILLFLMFIVTRSNKLKKLLTARDIEI
jgi:glycosyltransferase 2 family protein